MKVKVNGSVQEVESDLTVQKLLERMNQPVKTVAVAVNREFVPRKLHAEKRLKELDEVEILMPMQGG